MRLTRIVLAVCICACASRRTSSAPCTGAACATGATGTTMGVGLANSYSITELACSYGDVVLTGSCQVQPGTNLTAFGAYDIFGGSLGDVGPTWSCQQSAETAGAAPIATVTCMHSFTPP